MLRILCVLVEWQLAETPRPFVAVTPHHHLGGAGNGSVGAAEEALVRRGEGGRQKVLDAVVVKHAGTEAPQSVIMVCGFQFQHLVDLNCDGGRQLVLNIVHQACPVLFSIQNFRSFTHE